MMGVQILVLFGSIAFLYLAKNIFLPLILSIFLYFLLDPIITRLENKFLSRAILSPVLVTASVGVLLAGAWFTYLTIAEISSHIPEYSEKIEHMMSYFADQMEKTIASTASLFPDIKKESVQKVEVVHSMGDMTGYVFKGLDSIFGLLGTSCIVPILTLLLLVEKERIHEKLEALPVKPQSRRQFASKTAEAVQSFFLGNLVVGLLSAVLYWGVFAMIGLKNHVALSVGSGFFNLFPVLGPILALIFPMAQGLIQFDTFTPFLIMTLSSFFIHLVVANLILPKLMGSKVDLNVIAASIGMLFWGWLWGPIGIFLAVPLTAVIKVIAGLNESTKTVEVLLAESTQKPGRIVIARSMKALKLLRVPLAPATNSKLE